MKTTLKSLKPIADAVEKTFQDRGYSHAHQRHEGRGPGVNAQWLAGLLAALAIAGGCVAQQHLSRTASMDRRAEAATATLSQSQFTAPMREFQERLQTGYLDLAMAAYERRAFAIADFFARRSIEAGGATPPKPIAPDFDAPTEAASARRDLVEHLQSGGAKESPETAALAQLAVDCWLREAESDGALDILAGCRRQAKDALSALGLDGSEDRLAGLRSDPADSIETEQASAALTALVERWGPALNRSREAAEALAGPVAATLRRRALEPTATALRQPANGVETGSIAQEIESADASPAVEETRRADTRAEFFLDGFQFDSAAPSAGALARLDREVASGAASGARNVVIEGHADSMGAAGYNLALSERRARAVSAALSDVLGDKTPPIEIRAFGESQLAVATGDGVDEPRNRRVVVRFN